MNSKIIFASIAAIGFSSLALASEYACILKVRDHFMENFETIEGKFSGERPLELTVKGVILKFKQTGANESRRLALLLKDDNGNSAVTLGLVDQDQLYLNLLLGERFAVAECSSSGI